MRGERIDTDKRHARVAQQLRECASEIRKALEVLVGTPLTYMPREITARECPIKLSP
jgi:hypothetical protein